MGPWFSLGRVRVRARLQASFCSAYPLLLACWMKLLLPAGRLPGAPPPSVPPLPLWHPCALLRRPCTLARLSHRGPRRAAPRALLCSNVYISAECAVSLPRQHGDAWAPNTNAAAQLPDAMCRAWASAAPPPDLKLPPPNPYIPTDFTIKRPGHQHQRHAFPPPPSPPPPPAQPLHKALQQQEQAAKRARVSSQPATGAGAAAAAAASAAASVSVVAAGAHAASVEAAAAEAAELAECAELAAALKLPVVLATPPALIHDAPGAMCDV